MKRYVKNPTQLAGEFRAIVSGRGAMALMLVKGAMKGLDMQERAFGTVPSTGLTWILAAHKGTLEKLPLLLPNDRPPSSLELLSATRNLFENLIWLKLFELNLQWGVHFYGRLLQDEIEDLTGLVSKIEAEIVLFRAFDEEDTAIIETNFEGIGTSGRPVEEEIADVIAEHDREIAELDRRARRTFALYAAAATFNGYGYQAHLLETKELPRCRERLAKIQARMDEFKVEVADEALIKRYLSKFNWRAEAQRVGMEAQYDFLYRLTSRLLHSGPMNIVTEKELSESERTLLLEYMVVAANDAIDVVERFDFPGCLKIAVLEINAGEERGEI